MNDPASKSKASQRLALRAERAFGLKFVPTPKKSAAQPIKPASAQIATAPAEPLALSPQAKLPAVELSIDDKWARLQLMNENEVRGCPKCRLCQTRTQTVFGEGDANAQLFFIGEGPGEQEDLQGRPFVGRSGQLLDKWIAAMQLSREQVYIANIVKCRPPENREPAPDEVATCTPYLVRQLEIIRPRAIISLGRPAMQHLLQTKISMGKARGQWHSWRGIKLMPTYHPAYVLRNYTYDTRAAVWSDLQLVMEELGIKIPPRKTEKEK